MAVELVACRTCGAPNHPDRPVCGRCRTELARPTPDVFDRDDDEVDTGEVPMLAPDESDATDERDATVAAPPVVTDDLGDDATMASAPVVTDDLTVEAAARATPPPVDRVRERGAKVLDLLRGPDVSDTQPLDAGATAPTPGPSGAAARSTEPPNIHRRSVLAVSVLGVGLGAVVGIAAARGWLDATEQTGTERAFDAGVYRREPGILAVEDVRATSYLPPTGTNRYEPELVLDDDLTTAWNSDGAGRADGIGERFTVRLAEPAWVTAVEFANGYQKDDVRFLANARLAKATVEFDRGQRVNIVLLDQSGWQRVPLPMPILATSLELEVTETFPGDTYRDLALSGVRVIGHAAVGADRDAALDVEATAIAGPQS